MNLQLNGGLDLRLLAGMSPGLTIGGPAQMNAKFEGTLERPRINGRITSRTPMRDRSIFRPG